MAPAADIVIIFRSSAKTKQEGIDTEEEYTRLISTLKNAGLKVVGKKGSKQGQTLVFVSAPEHKLANLVQKERCV